jgi:hypothetical protein
VDHDDYPNDPGLRLSPARRRLLVALIIIGLLIALALALTDRAGAWVVVPASY